MAGKKLLMIPGPIEFDEAVLQEMGRQTLSHVAPDFIEVFGQALEKMRKVWLAPSGQPFILAGSGTLAMEAAVANLVEPGDRALVVNAGYFSDRMTAVLRTHGAESDIVPCALGDRPQAEAVRTALRGGRYKVMTITHVDTSTGVLADLKEWARLAGDAGVLTIADGVCSVAGEEMRQEEWGIDVVLTASQKAIGVPPGLALLVASPRAMETFRKRKQPVRSYYADWTNWLPVMEAYEARKPAYFGTPAVNLVMALNASLDAILSEGMEPRFERHRRVARAFRAAVEAIGLGQVPKSTAVTAHTMTAPYYPDGVDAALLGKVKDAGAVLAGGLHPEIRTRYFRIGHMGRTDAAETLATVGAMESGLARSGYRFEAGAGVAAAQREFLG